ncbi:hypothetical protein CKO37_13035 [Rubrivivax gelatinosus]|nr:hypothetical protein [Rubrivivax gelatinosus]
MLSVGRPIACSMRSSVQPSSGWVSKKWRSRSGGARGGMWSTMTPWASHSRYIGSSGTPQV